MTTVSANRVRPRVTRTRDLKERIVEYVAGDSGVSRAESRQVSQLVI